MDSSNPNCVFCRELSGSTNTNFHRLYPDEKSRVIAETPSLVAIPCIGQLSPNHCLILPKEHYATFAEACASIDGLFDELNDILLLLAEVLSIELHTNLYFEHGAFVPAHGGCGIYHAHLHVVPEAGAIALNLELGVPTTSSASTLNEALSCNHDDLSPYVLHGSATLGFHKSVLSEPLPSQTLRKLLAEKLGHARWDWRQYGRDDDTLLNTLRRCSK